MSVNYSSWKDMYFQVYKPAIKSDDKKKQTDNFEKINNKVIYDLANNLDNFSLMSTLLNVEDPTLAVLNFRSEPSMSLVENMNCYSHLEITSFEIGDWLNKSIIKLETRKSCDQLESNSLMTIKKQKISRVNSSLSKVAVNTLDRHALTLDYLPCIRTICRAEEFRRQVNNKRGNRFMHYLQGSRLSSGIIRTGTILSKACKIFQEEKPTMTETEIVKS